MKYCSKKLLCCLTIFILSGSISLFGQDPDAAWTRSTALAKDPSSKPEVLKPPPEFSPPVVTLPENLLPRLAITNADMAEFKRLLSEKDTGIFKLWNDLCGELKNIDAGKDTDCLEYSDYAFGSQYSLELEKYSGVHSNIILSKNNLSVRANQRQISQILMDLGKRDIREINKTTKEVVELSKIKMIDRFGVFQMNKILESDAIKSKRISLSYPADPDHIYLLRSVFLDERASFSWQRETVYVFQIMKLEDNIATIVWKKIHSKWV